MKKGTQQSCRRPQSKVGRRKKKYTLKEYRKSLPVVGKVGVELRPVLVRDTEGEKEEVTDVPTGTVGAVETMLEIEELEDGIEVGDVLEGPDVTGDEGENVVGAVAAVTPVETVVVRLVISVCCVLTGVVT